MGNSNGRERCGRCSFTTVVDAVEDGVSEDESEETARARYDPFDGGYIEVDERELRLASAPVLLASRLERWLDDAAARLIHGREQ
ncbi:hypothetical protein [Halomontanus rarus]|uniref:hypothetical protein n=1 Tax=Halomontanus rarus TaxID=3034020 RepID=UPI0023E7F4A1|nr:hypothetical protein [Halovivax sp. TS33]